MKKSTFLLLGAFLIQITAEASAIVVPAPAQPQEIITAAAPDRSVITLSVPQRAIQPSQVAILANLQDVQSVNTASYYAQVRGIPVENIIYLNFPPARKFIREAEFNTLKTQVDAAAAQLGDIQFYAIAWTEPWAVYHPTLNRGMSITSAFALSFSNRYYNDISSSACNMTAPTPIFNSTSLKPYEDHGIRPAMMLAGTSFSYVRDLIDRGLIADRTFPEGTGYLVRTNNAPRSTPRYQNFIATANAWTRPDGIQMTYVDNSAGPNASNFLVNKTDVFLYLTGITTVQNLTSNRFIPGGVGDHLTSWGGRLTGDNSQMSILRWLEAGATASYGTMQEPCAYAQKFPNAMILTTHYFQGATLGEAYWRSVQWPGEGVFIGDPLARPYGTRMEISSSGELTIKTTILKPNRIYTLLAANSAAGPYEAVLSDIRAGDQLGVRELSIPRNHRFYLLREDADPELPQQITDNGLIEMYPATNGQQVVWHGHANSGEPGALYLYDIETRTTKKFSDLGIFTPYPLSFAGKYVAYRDYTTGNSPVSVVDVATGERSVIYQGPLGASPDPLINRERAFWTTSDKIMMYDLRTQERRTLVSNLEYAVYDADGDILAWVNKADSPSMIRVLRISSGQLETLPLAETYERNNVRVTGSKIYWLERSHALSGELEMFQYDLSKHSLTKLMVVNGNLQFFAADEKRLVWAEKKSDDNKYSIYTFDLGTGATRKIKTGAGDQIADFSSTSLGMMIRPGFDLTDGRLVWINYDTATHQVDIHSVDLESQGAEQAAVAHWKFDETRGRFAKDSSDAGRDMSFHRDPVWVKGMIGGGVELSPAVLEGAGPNFGFADGLSVNTGDGAKNTVSFWMKPRRTKIANVLVWGDGRYRLGFYGQNFGFFAGGRVLFGVPAGGLYDRWVHVTAVFYNGVLEQENVKIYLDGVEQTLSRDDGPVAAPIKVKVDPKLYVAGGQHSWRLPPYYGILDDLKIFNRALSSEEIHSLAGDAPLRVKPGTRQDMVAEAISFGRAR